MILILPCKILFCLETAKNLERSKCMEMVGFRLAVWAEKLCLLNAFSHWLSLAQPMTFAFSKQTKAMVFM